MSEKQYWTGFFTGRPETLAKPLWEQKQHLIAGGKKAWLDVRRSKQWTWITGKTSFQRRSI